MVKNQIRCYHECRKINFYTKSDEKAQQFIEAVISNYDYIELWIYNNELKKYMYEKTYSAIK